MLRTRPDRRGTRPSPGWRLRVSAAQDPSTRTGAGPPAAYQAGALNPIPASS
ncbi:MAG: hypothetical protein JNJ70_00500 [Verrucomicrobiales bacterium]|nr:hypothetical protein [Verrucomicrobiales bacterium]